MSLFKKQCAEDEGLGSSSYAPIAQSFSNLAGDVRERLRHKFDIAYFTAIEKLPFQKYPALCELEQRHGVDIGMSYVNRSAGTSFIHYIAEARRQS